MPVVKGQFMDRASGAAEFLFELRRTQQPVAAMPEALVPRSLAEGYEAQVRLLERLLAQSGGRRIGYKAAATNPGAQNLLNVAAPFFGVLLSATSHRSPAALPAAGFTVRCVEAEFGFEIGRDVPPSNRPYAPETIREFIAAAIPAIEVVDHRYLDWKAVGAPSLVADNAIHGAWVEGEPCRDWRTIDFACHPVALCINGDLFSTGSGAAVLGNPLNVVAWLANELPRFGQQLRRGDKITTGTAVEVYLARPGDRAVADFGVLGRAEVSFLA